MNFASLNKIIFTKENPSNDYVSWDIGKEPLSPHYNYENLAEPDYRLIIQSKTQLDKMVYQCVLDFINNKDLCNNITSSFPQSDCLTGNYYIADESYIRKDDKIIVSIMAHLTEMFCGGKVTVPTEQDYLGLEVVCVIHMNGKIESDGVTPSSI